MYKPILVLKIPPHVAPEVIKTKFRVGVNGVSGRSVKRFSLSVRGVRSQCETFQSQCVSVCLSVSQCVSVCLSVYTCESLH